MYTYEDFLRAARGAGLYDSFSDADLKLAQQNADVGMGLLCYKQDYSSAATDEARTLAHLGAERLRAWNGSYSGGADGSEYNPFGTLGVTGGSAGSFAAAPAAPSGFSYDPESDPVYRSFRKQYIREGRRSAEDTLGIASAASGGIPSSYAVSAASQAGNYYASQLADRVPELERQAYDRYLDDYRLYLDGYQRYIDGLTKLGNGK